MPMLTHADRPDKGTRIEFWNDRVVKRFDAKPRVRYFGHWRAYQAERMAMEVRVYEKAARLSCPFIPRLLGHDEKDLWMAVERVAGENLLEHSLHGPLTDAMFTTVRHMDAWLRGNGFPETGTTLKDLIYDPDGGEGDGRLWLVDFEDARSRRGGGLFWTLIDDLTQRRLGLRIWRSTPENDRFARRVFAERRRYALGRRLYWSVLGRAVVLASCCRWAKF